MKNIDNYLLVFDKSAKKYPDLWWTGPSKNMDDNRMFNDDAPIYGKFIFIFILFWLIAYYLDPSRNKISISTYAIPFCFGLFTLLTWIHYFSNNSIIFYNSKTKSYYKYTVPHPRRIVTDNNDILKLKDNIGVIKIKDWNKLQRDYNIKSENFPDYSRYKNEILIKEGKIVETRGKRHHSQRSGGYNIAFILLSFAYLISQSKNKKTFSLCYYWIILAVLCSFIPHSIVWFNTTTDRNSSEYILSVNQFLTYLGCSFGFLASYIVYKKTKI